MSSAPQRFNQETATEWNQEPGIVVVPGSPTAREYSKFEQFPSRFTGNASPGNPYVYRAYPKMLYKAQHFQGKACCMAAPPDPAEFKDGREYERAEEQARRFTEKCQRIVNSEDEHRRFISDGWCESPDEAVKYLQGRDRHIANETAERAYQDRNMSDLAKREVEAVTRAAGGEHQPEITARKVKEVKDDQRR